MVWPYIYNQSSDYQLMVPKTIGSIIAAIKIMMIAVDIFFCVFLLFQFIFYIPF